MTENLVVNRQELFNEIIEKGRAQAVTDQEGYNALVEAVLEDHRRVGEIHDDADELAPFLQGRFADFKNELGF